jgi:hypothetical protein
MRVRALRCNLDCVPQDGIFHGSPQGLLRGERYANLKFCAEERAEVQCVREIRRVPGWFSGVVKRAVLR